MWSACPPTHAIGTSAVAVAASAAVSLIGHARARNVRWPCAIVFALAGIVGAAAGARARQDDGRIAPAALFGVLMIVVGAAMLRPRRSGDDPGVTLDRADRAATAADRWRHPAFGVGSALRLFRNRRWLSDRARPDRGDRHADAGRHRLVARLGYAVRRDHCGELCSFRAGRLAHRRPVRARRALAASLALARPQASRHKRALTYVFARVVISTGLYVDLIADR